MSQNITFTEDEIRDMIVLYREQEWSIYDIAEKRGVPYDVIHKLLSARIKLRGQREYAIWFRRIDDIQERIIRKIVRGEWKAGDQIPAMDQLSEEFGTGPNTIRIAIGDLEKRGFLKTLPSKIVHVLSPMNWKH